MKTIWERITLKNYATDNDPGDISPWKLVGAAVLLALLYLGSMIGAAAGF